MAAAKPRIRRGNGVKKPARRAQAAVQEAAHTTFYEDLPSHRQRFVDEYLKDLNAWQACIRAGLSGGTAYALLRDSAVIGAIKERRALLDNERGIEGARHVLSRLWDIETADPRDLVEIWKVPCRYCWGGGRYQYTKAEMHRRMQAHELGSEGKPLEALWPRGMLEHAAHAAGLANLPLDPQGGDGYTTNREPNPNCTECGGDGVTIQHVADTRKLSQGAQALYRGVKVNKEGKFEVLMADQGLARELLAKHYGVAVERKRLLVRKLEPGVLSDEELTQSLSELEDELHNGKTVDADYEVVDIGGRPNRPQQRPANRRFQRKLITRPA